MNWLYKGQEITPETLTDEMTKCEGFVYLITNTLSGKKYIGKKTLWSYRKKKVLLKNGKKVDRKVKSSSGWEDYWSSSSFVHEDVEKLGKENFKREILLFCSTRGVMSYWEAHFQYKHEVLLDQDNWYNQQIDVRLRSNKNLKEVF